MGGIATSLLFSIFEAWLIRAHADARLSSRWLSKSFTWAAYGNSIIAIASGLIANHAAESSTLHPVTPTSALHMGGYLAPFDMALVVSVMCGLAALYFWEENYGQVEALPTSGDHRDAPSSSSSSCWYGGGLGTAFTVTMRSREILLCGLVSSLYEGSMYVSCMFHGPHVVPMKLPQRFYNTYSSQLDFCRSLSSCGLLLSCRFPVMTLHSHLD